MMLLNDPKDHRKSEARTTYALGREEWFEHARTNFLRHADTIIDDGDLDSVRSTSGFESERPAIRERIHGIEDQVRECLA